MAKVYEKDYDYPVEAGRYRLVAAYPCPFAQRATIARELLGLEDAISLAITSNVKTEKIWDFSNQENGIDPILQVAYVSDLYKNTDAEYDGPYSVPVLVDIENKKVVNQESYEIIIDLGTRFKALHSAGAPDLYPEKFRPEIDGWAKRIGRELLGAPFMAGQAEKQAMYDKNAAVFYNAIDELDAHFAEHDYLVGNQLTLADILLFTPILRMDIVYYTAYGLNKKYLQEYRNLWAYMHRLYQIPAFKNSTDFQAIKEGSFLGKNGHAIYTKRQAIPIGPDTAIWDQPLN